ncbi:MAG TPA: hypothetical protein VJ715_00660 [Pyrinomonadaceae bacterium]|nr:hypothetical protein [Pyrinomonadaceae bacterium]
MKTKAEELIGLLDDARAIAEERLQRRSPDERNLSALETIAAVLQDYKEKVLSGTLSPSEGHVTLGLTRFVADWDELDSPLLKAVGKADRFYRDDF